MGTVGIDIGGRVHVAARCREGQAHADRSVLRGRVHWSRVLRVSGAWRQRPNRLAITDRTRRGLDRAEGVKSQWALPERHASRARPVTMATSCRAICAPRRQRHVRSKRLMTMLAMITRPATRIGATVPPELPAQLGSRRLRSRDRCAAFLRRGTDRQASSFGGPALPGSRSRRTSVSPYHCSNRSSLHPRSTTRSR